MRAASASIGALWALVGQGASESVWDLQAVKIFSCFDGICGFGFWKISKRSMTVRSVLSLLLGCGELDAKLNWGLGTSYAGLG